MNEDKEFQKKVQQAVDSYLARREKYPQMMEQIQNVIERESLIESVQKLITELITKLTERFITNMKKQVENEVLKMRETIRATHQRTYSAVDKEKVEDLVQRTLSRHDTQINMLLEHQAQLKSVGQESETIEKLEAVMKKQQEVIKCEVDEQIKSFSRNYNQKQQTIMQILNDLSVKIERLEEINQNDKKRK